MKKLAFTLIMGLMLTATSTASDFGIRFGIGIGSFDGCYGRPNCGQYRWHDTSHYDWRPAQYYRINNQLFYTPGHWNYHPTGHYDYYPRYHNHRFW